MVRAVLYRTVITYRPDVVTRGYSVRIYVSTSNRFAFQDIILKVKNVFIILENIVNDVAASNVTYNCLVVLGMLIFRARLGVKEAVLMVKIVVTIVGNVLGSSSIFIFNRFSDTIQVLGKLIPRRSLRSRMGILCLVMRWEYFA